MKPQPFVIKNVKTFNLWMNRVHRKPVCEVCKKDFKVGDMVMPRRINGTNQRTVYYHNKCWKVVSGNE